MNFTEFPRVRVIINSEKAKLEKENRIQRSLLDLQRKAHEILGIALPRIEDDSASDNDSSSSSDSAPRRSR